MIFKNHNFKNFISGLIITSILAQFAFFAFPTKETEAAVVAAVPVGDVLNVATHTTNTANTVKEWALRIAKELAMRTARNVINKITQQTINWINSGFHGQPLYLENPESFFKDIAKSEVRNLVDTFGYNKLKFPYGKDFAQSIVRGYQTQLETNAQYTFSNFSQDPVLLNAYRTNFNAGGWNGFLVNTQYPQNNYIGFNDIAYEELAHRLNNLDQSAGQKVASALEQGQGFLSPKICPASVNPSYNNGVNEFRRPTFQPTTPYLPPKRTDFPTEEAWAQAALSYEAQYQELSKAEKEVWSKKNTCPGGLVATTPGSVVANQIMTAMSSKYRQSELSAAMGNSLANIFDALLNKFFQNVTGGLRGLAGSRELNGLLTEGNSARNLSAESGRNGYTNGTTLGEENTEAQCPVPTTPKSMCETVDRNAMLAILNKYKPSNNGITAALVEIKTIHPDAKILAHPTRLDKIDFGGGLVVDVIEGAVGGTPDAEGTGWTWGVECQCTGPTASIPTGPGGRSVNFACPVPTTTASTFCESNDGGSFSTQKQLVLSYIRPIGSEVPFVPGDYNRLAVETIQNNLYPEAALLPHPNPQAKEGDMIVDFGAGAVVNIINPFQRNRNLDWDYFAWYPLCKCGGEAIVTPPQEPGEDDTDTGL